jgi:hypothetical protein
MPVIRLINRGPSPLFLRASRTPEEVAATGRDSPWELEVEVGARLVDSDFLDKIMRNDYCQLLFDQRCEWLEFSEGTQPAPKSPKALVDDVSTLTEEGAATVIARCIDPKQLEKWWMLEARPNVKKALHLRDRVLRPGDIDEEARDDLQLRRTEI